MEILESIQKYNASLENNISAEDYFRNILLICYEKKLLDESTLKKIAYERMEVLKIQLKYYTKDASSSVMVEVAEELMTGIDYTLGFYLKTFENMELIIEELKNTSLFEMLKMGHELIKKKVVESKSMLEEIQKNKLKVGNYAYNDTIDYGITIFFKEYDDFFAAHESSGSIDYPLHIDNMKYKSIEYLGNYLETLNLENEFCHKFDSGEINELLKGYDNKCELLLINIFELVLINSLGLIICNKSPKHLNISSMDREEIKRVLGKLSLEELQEILVNYVDKCCDILEIKSKLLVDYVVRSVFKIAVLIKNSIQVNKLETVFISFEDNEDKEPIEYIDEKKLSNSAFRELSEKIRECSSVNHKIILIKNNIKSLEDLVDILEAECLFEGEFIILFKELSQIEIILLSKHLSDLNLENDYEKEWYIEFNKFISSLNEEERGIIEKIKERIQLI